MTGGIDFALVFEKIPTAYLVLSPELTILYANDAYCATVGRDRDELVGKPVFEAFPPTPDALDPSGVSRIQLSFERARDTGRPDTMPIQKYDIPDPATGQYTERFWSLISIPIAGPDGSTSLVLQRTEDITDYIRERDRVAADREQSDAWRRRVADAEADLFARARELEAARIAEAAASRRLSALADVSLQLAQARTLAELTAVIFDRGMAALGAGGGSVAVLDGDTGQLRLTITESLGKRTQAEYALLPLDGPMPPSVAAATGTRVLLPNAAHATAWHPAMEQARELTGCQAWAALPLRAGQQVLGALTIGWREPQAFAAEDLDVLDALAAQCAYGLERVLARQAERAAALAAVRMSETLQRSLLTDPQQVDDLEIVVRYRPAAEQAQVGGDWYGSLLTSHGVTSITIGDVAGHDRDAAAAMGTLLNLLRGIAYAIGEPPAAVLSMLDRAVRDLGISTLATAVLAQVHQSPAQRETGVRTLRWSNAGHLPPLLLEPDGTARLLRTDEDLLLGLDPSTERTDHEVLLHPGATVLLTTDGLVERRGTSIDDGLAWLVDAAQQRAGLSVDALCDALLAEVATDAEDDIAMLVLRAHPQSPGVRGIPCG